MMLDIPTYGADGVVHPDVKLINGIYYMFYTPYPPEKKERICLVKSTDGVKWSDDGISNPLFDTDKLDTDPDVIFFYNQWLISWCQYFPHYWHRIRYASSRDLKTFTFSDAPVDTVDATQPSMFFDNINVQLFNCTAKYGNNRSPVYLFGNKVMDLKEDDKYLSGCGHIDVGFKDDTYYMLVVREKKEPRETYGIEFYISGDKYSWKHVKDFGDGYRACFVTDGSGRIVEDRIYRSINKGIDIIPLEVY